MHNIYKILICGFLVIYFSTGEIEANSTHPNPPSKISNTMNSSLPSCVGNGGTIPRYIYSNVTGSYLDKLRREPFFPQSPDHVEYLSALQSSYNWDNNYGSFIRGFIQAPETGQYVFNITGDDYCEFHISSDELPENFTPSDTTAFTPGYSGVDDHDKYEDEVTGENPQTSDTINLVAGNYYYFEVYQKEGGGGDHVQVYWKLPSQINQPEWELIHGTHLYEYICDPICPKKGTACDDGDVNTINDVEDGSCHCLGVPQTLPFACIGDRGNVKTLFWDSIEGDEIVDLQNHANYPLAPDRAVIYERLDEPNLVNLTHYGTRIRGYLYIPETGDYIFNVTGNNETIFYLGIGETTDPNTDEIAKLPDWTDHYDHYKYAEQTSDTLTLNAGTFYSIEMLHKEHSGSDHFYVFWKTPFARDTFWHIIAGPSLFQYDCELACIPEGTPCNDNDSNTFDDKYDANCDCVGTPCSDPECSNALGYTPYDQCGSSDKHSDNPNDAWLSCMPTQSPNAARGLGHWIHYDFGAMFSLDQAQIWNYNGEGGTGQGFNNVIIDYSIDGITWTELGTYNWAQATGNSSYSGFTMSEFNGIVAQHVLITAIDNFDSSNCMGVSEISFSAFTCPVAGTACDDGDIETINDTYDAFCICSGLPITNECVVMDTIVNDDPIANESFQIEATITSAGQIYLGGNVQFIAGTKVLLLPGFKVESGGDFLARILPCNIPLEEDDPSLKIEVTEKEDIADFSKAFLKISPNPTRTWTTFNFNIPISGNVQLGVYTSSGQLVTIIVNTHQEEGLYDKEFPAQQLAGGVYYVTLRTDEEVLTKRLVVVD